MFTGIVQGLGTVKSVSRMAQGCVLAIAPDFELDRCELGESIAVNGVCLTATAISSSHFTADVSPETLSRTTLGELGPGSRVNLERALQLSDRLGGHIVSGHIDCVGQVAERRELRDFTLFTFRLENRFDRYLIEKGSVAIDGISLTVNSCSRGEFSVAIIPHTCSITTLGFRKVGHRVNIELDVIGKYVEKLLQSGRGEKAGRDAQEIDTAFLARHGFL
jgi:riboflavin synthase